LSSPQIFSTLEIHLHRGRRAAPHQERGPRRRLNHGRRNALSNTPALNIARRTSPKNWRLHVRGSTVAPTPLLSVSVRCTEHQRLHSVKPGSASPFSPTVPRGEPGVFDGDAHQLGIARPARDVFLRDTAYAFSCAPSGTVPVSTYRQSAMRSFRARATMPMRRIRFPPPPNRSRYQRLSALVG
jgi:hypothetical protein